MPKVGDFYEGFRANEFVLVIDGTESPGVNPEGACCASARTS